MYWHCSDVQHLFTLSQRSPESIILNYLRYEWRSDIVSRLEYGRLPPGVDLTEPKKSALLPRRTPRVHRVEAECKPAPSSQPGSSRSRTVAIKTRSMNFFFHNHRASFRTSGISAPNIGSCWRSACQCPVIEKYIQPSPIPRAASLTAFQFYETKLCSPLSPSGVTLAGRFVALKFMRTPGFQTSWS